MQRASADAARKVQAILGDRYEVLEFPDSTRTAAEAAAAIGCTVAQIAKSLVFRTLEGALPVLVIASGSNRVDTAKLAALIGQPVARADADFVRAATGFAIGGVPPVGHLQPAQVLIDGDLQRFEVLWAAAGTPNAVFRLTPADLVRLTGGRICELAQRS